MAQAGYLPVVLRWDPVGARPLAAEITVQQAEAYFLSLLGPGAGPDAKRASGQGPLGYVDDFTLTGDQAVVRGWAIDAAGSPVNHLAVSIAGKSHVVTSFERQMRPDVQQHLRLPHSLFGFRLIMPVPARSSTEYLLQSLEVRAGNAEGGLGPPLLFAAPLQRTR